MYLSMGHMMWGWSSGNCERESRGNGDHTASADNSRNGDQSEVFFYQWSQRTFFIKRRIWIPWLLLAQGASYGYSILCSVCDDRCADAWECGRSNDIYA